MTILSRKQRRLQRRRRKSTGLQVRLLATTLLSISFHDNRVAAQVPPFDINTPNWAPTVTPTSSASSSTVSPTTTPVPMVDTTEDAPTTPTAEQVVDVRLQQVQTAFDSRSVPEFTFLYKASPLSAQDNSYYRLRIMTPECQSFDTTGEFLSPWPPTDGNEENTTKSDSSGMVPLSQYDSHQGLLTAYIDMDTTRILNSTYWTREDEGDDASSSRGVLEFCTRLDLIMNDFILISEANRIFLHVDTSQEFEVTDIIVSRRQPTDPITDEVDFNYTLQAFFCSANGTKVRNPVPRYPGQPLRLCVQTETDEDEDAVVQDVRSLQFVNTLNSSLVFPVIDDQGVPADNATTTKTCDKGMCQIVTAVTVRDMYEYDVNGDGELEDVSDHAWLQGTAILSFPDPNIFFLRRRRVSLQISSSTTTINDNNNAGETAEFALKVSLMQPPKRADAASKSNEDSGIDLAGIVGIAVGLLVVSGIGVVALGIYVNKYIIANDNKKNGINL